MTNVNTPLRFPETSLLSSDTGKYRTGKTRVSYYFMQPTFTDICKRNQ